jgi:hypothetical protein
MSPASTSRSSARAGALLLAVLALVAALGWGAGAAAGTPATGAVRGAGAARAVKAADDVTASLVSLSPSVVHPGDDVTVTVDVRNTTAEPLEHPRATLTLSRYRDSTRAELDSWTSSAPTGDVGDVLGTATDASALPPGATWRATITIDAAELRLSNASSAWGPRGIAVSVTDGVDAAAYPADRLAVLRSFLLWYPVDGSGGDATTQVRPISMGVAVPVTGPALDLGDAAGTATAVTAAVGAGSRLADVVDATRGESGVTWAADPALVALASRSSDAATSSWARAVCAQASDHDTYALPAFDPDVAAYAHAARALPRVSAAVTTADCSGTESRTAGSAGTATDPTAPKPGATPSTPAKASGAAPAPLTGTNLAAKWKKLLWPAEGVPDAQTIAAASEAGAKLTVARPGAKGPFTLTQPSADPPDATDTVTADGRTAKVLVADAQLSDLLADTAAATTAGSLQDLLAQTAVIARQSDDGTQAPAAVLTAMPRDWDPDPSVWSAHADTLDAAPWVRLASLSQIAKAPAVTPARVAPAERTVSDQELAVASVDALANARASVGRFSTIAAQPSTVLQQHQPQLLTPASVAFRDDAAGRSRAVSGALTEAGALVRSVSVVPSSTFNLISAAGDLPITVRNDLEQPVTVRVVLHSSDPKLVVGAEPELTVPARGDETARIPVKAIGNGNVSAYVELVTPTGGSVSTAEPFDVRVRADWETVGTAAIVVLLGVALVAGIWRTVRRGRSTARTTRAQAPEAEVAGTPEAPPTGSTPAAPPPDAGPDDHVSSAPTGVALRVARPVPDPEELPSDPATPAGRSPSA